MTEKELNNEEICAEVKNVLVKLLFSEDDNKILAEFAKIYVFDKIRILNGSADKEIIDRFKAYGEVIDEILSKNDRGMQLTIQETNLMDKVVAYTNELDKMALKKNEETLNPAQTFQTGGFAFITGILILAVLFGFILSIVMLYIK